MKPIIPLFKHNFDDFTIINEDKNAFIDELLKTMEYYYTPSYLFFLKDSEVKYYCKLKGVNKEYKEINGMTTFVKNPYIHLYDIEKKKIYAFYGCKFFLEHDDFNVCNLPNFLETEEGKEYYRHYWEVKNSKDYFTIQFFWESFMFKEGNPRCVFHNNGHNGVINDFVNRICFKELMFPFGKKTTELQTAKVLMLADRPYIFL